MYQHSHPHSAAQPTCTIALDERDGRTHAAVELHWGGSYLADRLLLFNGVRH
jgi:hypothetical protein